MSRGLTSRSRGNAYGRDATDGTNGAGTTDDDGSAPSALGISASEHTANESNGDSRLFAASGSEPREAHGATGNDSPDSGAPGSDRNDAGTGGSGRGSASRRRNRRATRADSGETQTTEHASSGIPRLDSNNYQPTEGAPKPKSVPYPPIKQSQTQQKQSIELLGDGYEALFFVFSLFFGDHWQLENELEREQLAVKTRAFVEKMGKKRAKAVLDLLDGPALAALVLLSLLASVIIPRITKTQKLANAIRQKQRQEQDTTKQSESAPSVAASPVSDNAVRSIDERLRPARGSDLDADSSQDIDPIDGRAAS